ncbi:5031_t:CDS:2, partial [Gigaspora rosea]
RAPPLIELSDRVFPTSDVPIAPMTASYEYASAQITSAEIKKLLDNQGKLMHKVDRLMARFEEIEKRIDSRLRVVEDKLFAMLDVFELQSFVE